MDLDQILFDVVARDNYMLDPLASVSKQANGNIPTPTRLEHTRLLYNPELLDKMEEDGTAQVLGEVTHNALLHPSRRRAITCGMRGLEATFDIASDLAVFHNIAPDSKRFVQPKDFKFNEGLAAEEYFNLLLQAMDEQGIDPNAMASGGDAAHDVYSKILDAMGVEGKQAQDHSQWSEVPMPHQQGLAQMLREALSRHRGNLPAGLERLLKLLAIPPQISWQQRLRRLAGSLVLSKNKRYTYKKQSRRYGHGYPGTVRQRRGRIYAHIDTSGSMDDVELQTAMVELRGVSEGCGSELVVITGDAEVETVTKIDSKHDLPKVKVKGGGGTDHRPLFQYLKDQKQKVDLLICFTDLYTAFPEEEPKYPVIWVTTQGDQDVPFGEKLVINRIGDKDG